jgi:Methyltransferase domain
MTLRYGHGKPVHAELESLLYKKGAVYASWLDQMFRFEPDYRAILERLSPMNPDFYTGATLCFDCAAIHTMVSTIRPNKWIEVGSGHSTAFAMNAALMHSVYTKFEVVDPAAGDWLYGFPQCTVHRAPANDVPIETFTSLAPGDILFIDGSHVSNAGSDVAIMFLEVLPRLKPGVWVHIHDIFLPSDYPPEWGDNRQDYYTEQYMLALLLLMDKQNRYQVQLPMYYCLNSPAFKGQVDRLKSVWADGREPTGGPQTRWDLSGAAFWMRIV